MDFRSVHSDLHPTRLVYLFTKRSSKNIEPRSMMHVTLARFLVGDEKRSAIEILEYLFSNFSEKPYTKNDD